MGNYGHPNREAQTVDEFVKLRIEMVTGEGRYKTLFGKQKVNFKIKGYITNPEHNNLKKLVIYISCRGNEDSKKVHVDAYTKKFTVEFDEKREEFSGYVTARAELEYKISAFKSKNIAASVSLSV